MRESELDAYIKDVYATELLTRKEEIALGKQISRGRRAKRQLSALTKKILGSAKILGVAKDGQFLRNAITCGISATKQLSAANIRLVFPLAKYYRRKFPETEFFDIVQGGNCGLVLAAQKFSWRRGKFSTWAVWCIRAGIQSELRSMITRLPTVSLDILVGSEKRNQKEPLSRIIEDKKSPKPDEEADRRFLGQRVRKAILRLNKIDREVIILRFGLGNGKDLTPKETGKVLGCSRKRAWVKVGRALKRLRQDKSLEKLAEIFLPVKKG